jgi:hypothetical protein
MTTRMSSSNIIASTFSMDIAEMPEHRYQSTRWSSPAVYNFGGDMYYAVSKTKPKHDLGGGRNWKPCRDQFWAKKAGTVLWELDGMLLNV